MFVETTIRLSTPTRVNRLRFRNFPFKITLFDVYRSKKKTIRIRTGPLIVARHVNLFFFDNFQKLQSLPSLLLCFWYFYGSIANRHLLSIIFVIIKRVEIGKTRYCSDFCFLASRN